MSRAWLLLTRRTADGVTIGFWSDGRVTGPFGVDVEGATGAARDALRVADDVAVFDFGEVGALVHAARRTPTATAGELRAAACRAIGVRRTAEDRFEAACRANRPVFDRAIKNWMNTNGRAWTRFPPS